LHWKGFWRKRARLQRWRLQLRTHVISQAFKPAASRIMVWLILEGVLALVLFVFIIWWTLPRKPGGNKDGDQEK
jgi:hypothetical protein